VVLDQSVHDPEIVVNMLQPTVNDK